MIILNAWTTYTVEHENWRIKNNQTYRRSRFSSGYKKEKFGKLLINDKHCIFKKMFENK